MLLRLFMLMLVVFIAAGCRQDAVATDNPNIEIDVIVNSERLVVGEAYLFVQVRDAEDNFIDGAKVNVRGDMSHAGMTPVIRDIETGRDGQYETLFEWTMAGEWFLDVTVTLPDGTQDKERFEYVVGVP
jgi:hypothetical protein